MRTSPWAPAPPPAIDLVTIREPVSMNCAPTDTVVLSSLGWARISRWASLTLLKFPLYRYTLPDGTTAVAVADSVAVPMAACWSQIWAPFATVAPLTSGVVAVASENMAAPVAFTTAGPSGLVTVYGPSGVPIGPVAVAGAICRLRGGGCTRGPLVRASSTMAATAGRSGSVVDKT